MSRDEKETTRLNARNGGLSVRDSGELHLVRGFRTAALSVGLKSDPVKPDAALLYCDAPKGAAAAGVFTRNRVVAAPVTLSRRHLRKSGGRARAIFVNAGNANACTGVRGAADARETARLMAAELGCSPEEVLVCSTGIIGRPLPMDKIARGVVGTAASVRRCACLGSFAKAILTTDLVEKRASVSFELGGRPVRLVGVCKGSGMIAPNTATMLAFLATDAAGRPAVLQAALRSVADETFNCLTVDGDTSTNDAVLLLASGAAGHRSLAKTSGRDYEAFRAALFAVCDRLAARIAADGEGAAHFVTVLVRGPKTDAQARRIARTIAESPLVKTALAGNDPNWGRIVAAAGRAGIPFAPAKASLAVCGRELWRGGMPVDFNEQAVSREMKKGAVEIVFSVGNGPGRARFYTCDFTHGYITINADYHT